MLTRKSQLLNNYDDAVIANNNRLSRCFQAIFPNNNELTHNTDYTMVLRIGTLLLHFAFLFFTILNRPWQVLASYIMQSKIYEILKTHDFGERVFPTDLVLARRQLSRSRSAMTLLKEYKNREGIPPIPGQWEYPSYLYTGNFPMT